MPKGEGSIILGYETNDISLTAIEANLISETADT